MMWFYRKIYFRNSVKWANQRKIKIESDSDSDYKEQIRNKNEK